MPIRRGLLPSLAVASLAVVCLGDSTRPSPAPSALLIRDVTILAMNDEAPRRGSVLVRGDRIEYVGPTASLPPAPNAQIVDGSGRFLIPGLIDMHTHVSSRIRAVLYSVAVSSIVGR